MTKKLFAQFLILMCFLSFPVAAFASNAPLVVDTNDATEVTTATAVLQGTTTRDGVSNYGFQYGETTDYGQQTDQSDILREYSLDDSMGSMGEEDGQFSYLASIAVDADGNVYAGDSYRSGNESRIQKFDSDGNFVRAFGSYGNGDGQFEWNGVSGLAVDAQGNVYASDYGHNRVQKFDSDGNFLMKFGSAGSGEGQFAAPCHLTVDSSGNIYVVDTGNNRVEKFDSNGNFIRQFGTAGTGDGQFQSPRGIAIDSHGNVLVVDTDNHRVQKFDSDGNYISQFGSYGSDNGQFYHPWGIAIADSGKIVIGDKFNNRVQIFDADGNFVSIIPSNNDFSNYWELNVASNSSGNIYVQSAYQYRVVKFVSTGLNSNFSRRIDRLACETQYHYRAFATNDNGTSYGPDQTFTTETCSPGPIDLQGTPASVSVALTWEEQPNVNPDRHIISYKKSSDSEWTQYEDDMDSQNPSTTITGLESETEYEFRVATVFYNNQLSTYEQSAFSDALEITTLAQGNYLITNCRELQAIGMDPVTKEVGDMEGHYVLANDIDCAESASWEWPDLDLDNIHLTVRGFYPIIDPSKVFATMEGFRGVLDGAGHSVSNITQETNMAGGVFELIQDGIVKNVDFENLTISLDGAGLFTGGLSSITSGNARIDNVTLNGSISTIEQTGPQQPSFDYIRGIAVAPDGSILAVDNNRDRVVKMDSSGNYLSKFGQSGYENLPGQLDGPESIAVDESGNSYVIDQNQQDVNKFDSEGNFVLQFGSNGSDDGQFQYPQGIAVDSDGFVYVADSNNARVQKFDAAGNFVSKFGSYGSDEGQFEYPQSIAVDSNGNIYVGDEYLDTVQKFNSDFNYVTSIGNSGEGEFQCIAGIATRANGDILISDSCKDDIQVFDSSSQFVLKIGGSAFRETMVGGVVGSPGIFGGSGNTLISNTLSNMNITLNDPQGTATPYIGGITSYGNAKIEKSKYTGAISVEGSNAYILGGISAFMYGGSISDSYASSEMHIEGGDEAIYAGGLVGYAEVYEENDNQKLKPIIQSSYSSGSMDIGDEPVLGGFIVGGLAGMAFNLEIHDSFSAETFSRDQNNSNSLNSQVQGGPDFQIPIGGIVGGEMTNDVNDFSNNSFDQALSGADNCFGALVDHDTEEMIEPNGSQCEAINIDNADASHYKGNSSVDPFGEWDFENTWKVVENGYPELRGGTSNDVEEPQPVENDSNGSISGDLLKDQLIGTIPSASTNAGIASTIDLPVSPEDSASELLKVLGDKEKRPEVQTTLANSKPPSSPLVMVAGLSAAGTVGAYAFWLLSIKKGKVVFSSIRNFPGWK